MNDTTPYAGTTEPTPGIGHNLDPFQERKMRVEELIETANKWILDCPEITNEDQAARARDFKNLLKEAAKTNEKTRKSMTDPLREQIQAITDQFKRLNPFIDKSVEAIDRLLAPWLEKLERERQEKARLEREEAERLAREAEEKRRAVAEAERKAHEAERQRRQAAEEAARRAAEGDDTPAPPPPPVEPAEPVDVISAQVEADEAEKAAEKLRKQAERTERGKVAVKGETGRGGGFRTVWKATSITDLDEAFAYYRNNPKVSELLLSLASADARSGRRRIPGFRVEAVRSVN